MFFKVHLFEKLKGGNYPGGSRVYCYFLDGYVSVILYGRLHCENGAFKSAGGSRR